MVNAVYHRSYEIREPIEVRVLPDSITVVSYPGPDRSIRLEDLETGRFAARRYRNRRIGEFLKELKLTEGRGTGIPKILKAMKANGSPKPQFEADEDRTYFIARFSIHPSAKKPVVQESIKGEYGKENQDRACVEARVRARVEARVNRGANFRIIVRWPPFQIRISHKNRTQKYFRGIKKGDTCPSY